MPGINEAIKVVFQKSEELATALNEVRGKEMPLPVSLRFTESSKKFHEFQLWFSDGANVKRAIDAEATAEKPVIVQP